MIFHGMVPVDQTLVAAQPIGLRSSTPPLRGSNFQPLGRQLLQTVKPISPPHVDPKPTHSTFSLLQTHPISSQLSAQLPTRGTLSET